MATADLVELMLNTRFPADRIVDWVDQAMLYTQFGPDKGAETDGQPDSAKPPRALLREHGIRTASALVSAYEMARVSNDGDRIERILGGEGRIRTVVDTLPTNPNLELVQQWRRLSESLSVKPGLNSPEPSGFRVSAAP